MATIIHDRASDLSELELCQNDLRQLSNRLEVLLRPRNFTPNREAQNRELSNNTAVAVEKIRRILKFRDTRKRIFDEDLFADPAWDMLLEIFICGMMQKRISVSDACLSARVPATTGLRWLKILEEKGLVRRAKDLHDARRVLVSLTEEAFTKMRLLVDSQEFHLI